MSRIGRETVLSGGCGPVNTSDYMAGGNPWVSVSPAGHASVKAGSRIIVMYVLYVTARVTW